MTKVLFDLRGWFAALALSGVLAALVHGCGSASNADPSAIVAGNPGVNGWACADYEMGFRGRWIQECVRGNISCFIQGNMIVGCSSNR
jgi:hypothetical protein